MRSLIVVFTGISLFLTLVLVPEHAAADNPGSGSSTGTGLVFYPNPVAQLQDQSLRDQKDADYPALQRAYRQVTLTNLDGSGYLTGDWASVRSSTGPLAYSGTNSFMYKRDDDRFEQVMAYFWATESQKYIQSLGFGGTRRAINKQSQPMRIDQWGQDNAYYWEKHNVLRFGKGGVDDAEDAEVILHEYGHAIQGSQVPGFGASAEAGAIGEGFADYWAVTVTAVIAATPDPACVADWDSVEYTSTVPHCLRRIDRSLRYPQNLTGRVHADGQIWSRALWDIRGALGHVRADTLILEGQFAFAPDTSMPAAATATVEAARRLYGSTIAAKVRKAFTDRGIL